MVKELEELCPCLGMYRRQIKSDDLGCMHCKKNNNNLIKEWAVAFSWIWLDVTDLATLRLKDVCLSANPPVALRLFPLSQIPWRPSGTRTVRRAAVRDWLFVCLF